MKAHASLHICFLHKEFLIALMGCIFRSTKLRADLFSLMNIHLKQSFLKLPLISTEPWAKKHVLITVLFLPPTARANQIVIGEAPHSQKNVSTFSLILTLLLPLSQYLNSLSECETPLACDDPAFSVLSGKSSAECAKCGADMTTPYKWFSVSFCFHANCVIQLIY